MLIVNPAGSSTRSVAKVARRPPNLAGLRLGLLDNGKPKADVMMKAVGRLLNERYPLASTFYIQRGTGRLDTRKTGGNSFDEILQQVVGKCDVVVNGVGD